MKIFQNLNLKKTGFLLLLFSFFIGTTIQWVDYYHEFVNELKHQETLHLENLEMNHLDHKLESVNILLNSLMLNPALREKKLSEIKDIFEKIILKFPFIHHLTLLDVQGELLLTSPDFKGRINLKEAEFFKKAIVKDGISFDQTTPCPFTGTAAIHFSVPIKRDHKIIAVLALAIDEKLFTSEEKYKDKRILTDYKGNVFISFDPQYQKASFYPHFDKLKTSPEPQIINYKDVKIFYKTIKFNNDIFGYLIHEVDINKIRKPLLMRAINRIGFASFIYLLMFLILLYSFQKMLYSPILEIEQAMRKLDVNSSGITIDKKYQGELKRLAEHFNRLSEIIKRDTEKLLQEKQFWEITFNASPDIIFVVDRDFNIIRANKSFLDSFNINTDNLGEIKCYQIAHNLDYPIDFCPQKDVIEKRESYVREHFFSNLKKWFLVSISPIFMDNEFLGALHIFKDITFVKEAEEERRRIEIQLLHTQRLESLGILAGGVAHDFNNLLMGILGNTELALMKRDMLSKEVVDNLETIKLITEKASHLTRQMLAYSGKGKFVLKEIDVNRFIKEIYDLIKVSLSKKVTLHLNLDESQPLIIKGDPGQIEQVLINLVINANEAIEDKEGLITITTGRQWCDRKYFDSCVDGFNINYLEGYYVYIEVTDNGCGMDRETMSKIFEPFFTTKFTGRGLGLSAVLGIIRGHRGALKVYSEKGKGSSFKIIFPEEKPSVEIEQNKPYIKNLNKTVLIIDDEDVVRNVTRQIIEAIGGKVITACDGREGLEIFKNQSHIIDLVLLDLTMPGLNGEEVFRELKKIKGNVSVVLMSGYNDQDISQKLVGKGFAGFIQKPFNIDTLLKILS